jgi:amidase
MSPRSLLISAFLCCALLAACRAQAADSDEAIVESSAEALRAELAAGRLTAERVAQAFLARIEALNHRGPALAAVIETNPDALAAARALDRQLRATGAVVGPLHGLPVLLKANIDTADRLATSAGSLALAGHHAAADASLVTRLRKAGAVILGKTNLSEWANFRSRRSTSGWSSVGGQTRNPYVLDRNPCGSSSGSAAAVAARLAPLAIGTETDGSIVCPAAANGVVGVKPTLGIVSQRGIVPIAASQDTAGPIARTVADAQLLLAAIADPDCACDVRGPGAAAAAAVTEGTLRGVRIGVVRDFAGAGREPAVEQAFAGALALLEDAGATLVDPLDLSPPAEVEEAELEILLHEFRDGLNRYLEAAGETPRSLREVIEFNAAHAADVLPYFGQDLLAAADARTEASEPAYRAALASVAAYRARLDEAFASHGLDAAVAPANGRAWLTDWQRGDASAVGSSSIAALSGRPSVALPVSLAHELPLGLALIGRPRGDAALLAVAAEIERRRGPFPAPRYLASVAE